MVQRLPIFYVICEEKRKQVKSNPFITTNLGLISPTFFAKRIWKKYVRMKNAREKCVLKRW